MTGINKSKKKMKLALYIHACERVCVCEFCMLDIIVWICLVFTAMMVFIISLQHHLTQSENTSVPIVPVAKIAPGIIRISLKQRPYAPLI